MLSVGGDIDVVHWATHWDALGFLHRRSVDDVEPARTLPNSYQHPLAIFGDGEIIRMPAERHFFQNMSGISIYHIEDTVGFATDVNSGPIRAEDHAVRELDAINGLHCLVGRGIDHIDGVACAIRNVNPHFGCDGGRRLWAVEALHPFRNS